MILSVLDRITLLNILPEQGDFITLKIVRKLRESLSFSEEEIKAIDLRQENQRIFWNTSVDPMKDVEIGEKATDIVIESLKKLNEQKQLTAQHINLYETFVSGVN